MIVAVASGKGGAGKTTVAVSLARAAAERCEGPSLLVDCDVEGPNADLLAHPEIHRSEPAGRPVPVVDAGACTLCGRCAEVCAFGAISVLPDRVLIAHDLCKSCGSCLRQCPEGALREESLRLGELRQGAAGALAFAQGRLDVGQARAAPLIRALKRRHEGVGLEGWVIVDAPPGSACAALEALRGADVILLVAEPTPLGLHDLALLVEAARAGTEAPLGVIINRSRGRDAEIEGYCRRQGLPVLERIPFRREIAAAGAEGRPLDEILLGIGERWRALLESMLSGEAP